MHRKAVLFLFVFLKINLLLNFFKYLLLWVEGRKKNFFSLDFALGRNHFCALPSPEESRIRVSDLDIIYHFIVGHAQLLYKQIVRLPGHFPQG